MGRCGNRNKTERTELIVMMTPHIISGKTLTTGDRRDFGISPGKDYQEYQAITPDKKLISLGESGEVGIKPYRDTVAEEVFIAKEKKYEPN